MAGSRPKIDWPSLSRWWPLDGSYSWMVRSGPQFRVVGRHRKSLDWIACYLRPEYATNWRVELVYQPGALVRLKKEGWLGFGLKRGDFVCPEDKSSPDALRLLLERLGLRLE